MKSLRSSLESASVETGLALGLGVAVGVISSSSLEVA